MCGIAGILDANRPAVELQTAITAMLASIRHRGPDGSGAMVADGVALGMNRLAIVNTNPDQLPYVNEDGNLTLVFNGEIYNYEELFRDLSERHQFRTRTDSEAVLHAFEEWGTAAPLRFNGMYAIALYDRRRGELLLYRDKAGEKPLHYYFDGKRFMFASEIKALLTQVRAELNPDCQSYPIFEFCADDETLFRNIYTVRPGEELRVTASGTTVVKRRYWSAWDNPLDIPDDENRIINDLTELLEDSIRLRTRNTAFAYACLVSGGIDSALVAAIARPQFLFTLTYDTYGPDYNELPYAQAVADRLGQPLTIIRPTADDFSAYRETIIYHQDLPGTWTGFNMYCVLKELSHAAKVFLTGEGIDELFGGYHRYHLLHHDQQIHELAALDNYGYLIDKYYGSPVERYARLINRSPESLSPAPAEYLHGLIRPYFERFPDVVHAMGATDLYTTLQIILHMSDRMSMAHSIENRAPFLDHRLMQYAFSMPAKYKIRNGITKHIIKRIAEKFVPEAVVARKDKRGFLAPVNQWFGWDKGGKFNRSEYGRMVYDDWHRVFISGGEIR